MSNTIMITGEAHSHDIDCEIARRWTLNQIDITSYMYSPMLAGLIKSRIHYTAVKDIAEEDFLHGVYLALCDHFSDGMDLEDLSEESQELLHLNRTPECS